MSDTSRRLKDIRKKRGHSQAVFAKQLGLVLRTYQRYESGDTPLSEEVFIALDQLGINLHWILSGNGEMEGSTTAYVEKIEALAHYWEANSNLLTANIEYAKTVVSNKLGKKEAAKLFTAPNRLKISEVRLPTSLGKQATRVAEKDGKKR